MSKWPELYPGDIVGVTDHGWISCIASRLIYPPTNLVHFFLIGDYLPWDDDYVILESIGRGISVGRLSFYNLQDLEFYRVRLDPEDMELRKRAAAALTLAGRANYDYWLIVKLFIGAAWLFLRRVPFPWRPSQFPYGRDGHYICTEAAAEGWRLVNHPVIPEGVVPLPAGFVEAYLRNRLEKVD